MYKSLDQGGVVVFTGLDIAAKPPAGIDVIPSEREPGGRISIPFVLQTLAARGVTRLMVEGGQAVLTSFLQSGLWDEFYLYRSTDVIGEAGLDAAADPSLMPR
ncbi:MAG: hypothetical protein DI598_20710, partial [Pseudopedobacter saltans]